MHFYKVDKIINQVPLKCLTFQTGQTKWDGESNFIECSSYLFGIVYFMDLLGWKKMLNKMLLNLNQQLGLKNCIFYFYFYGELLKSCI